MNKKVIVIGIGRMGVRHLRGINGIQGLDVFAVDSSEKAIADAKKNVFNFFIEWHHDLTKLSALKFDIAIISSTADARLENLEWCIEHGVKNILLEKPLAQSRGELDMMGSIIKKSSVNVYCNFYRRQLKYCLDIKQRIHLDGVAQRHLTMIVASGAMGLACNGLHYIDSAIHLTESQNPVLVSGWLDKTPIQSGRGIGFSDFGGCAVIQLNEYSKLILNVMADSSAPTILLYYENHELTIVDQDADITIQYLREKNSEKPYYLYGQEYNRSLIQGGETVDLSKLTKEWVLATMSEGKSNMPLFHSSIKSHYLLFDLLEVTGQDSFQFT